MLGTKRGVLLELSLAHLRTLNPDLRVSGLSATLPNLPEALHALMADCVTQAQRHGDIDPTADPTQVAAPIPGLIAQLSVSVGSKVTKGDKLLMMEDKLHERVVGKVSLAVG